MFFRRGTSHGRWLEVKIGIFTVGALLALAGMALNNDWLMGIAGVLLLAGMALRFLDAEPEEREED